MTQSIWSYPADPSSPSDVLVGFAVEATDEDGTCRLQTFDEDSVTRLGRAIAIDLGACPRRQPGDVEQILDRERYPRQWTKCLSASDLRIDDHRPGPRPGCYDVGESVKRRVEPFNPP